MFSFHYLQTIAALLIVGEITIRLLKEIFKTKEKQRSREGLLRLNWTIHDPQIIVFIKSTGAIIFILVSVVILTGIMQKTFTP